MKPKTILMVICAMLIATSAFAEWKTYTSTDNQVIRYFDKGTMLVSCIETAKEISREEAPTEILKIKSYSGPDRYQGEEVTHFYRAGRIIDQEMPMEQIAKAEIQTAKQQESQGKLYVGSYFVLVLIIIPLITIVFGAFALKWFLKFLGIAR